MSHEATTRPLAITYSDYDWGDNITSNDYNYFYVPSIPEWAYSEFDGLVYEGVQYNWNGVPEPSFIGLFMGFCLLALTLIKRK